MLNRTLGNSGLEVAAIGHGWISMGWSYGPADRQQMIALIRHAVELPLSVRMR